MDEAALIEFEREVAELFNAKKVLALIHLLDGNERQLIDIFQSIHRDDWVFATYRNHHHALLHGIPADWLRQEILAGRTTPVMYPERRFFTSGIVGGTIPIATGVAMAIKRRGESRKVWAFIGDMAASAGVFYENVKYAEYHDLPISFVVEDNGMCIDAETDAIWGGKAVERVSPKVLHYCYKRQRYSHSGSDRWVRF